MVIVNGRVVNYFPQAGLEWICSYSDTGMTLLIVYFAGDT